MKKNLLLIALWVVQLFSFCNSEIRGQEQIEGQRGNRPNILFIMSDDHAYQAISAYNNTLIETPNKDRIAREGMLFEN